LEKGEAAIVGGQFLALAVLVLLLGNYAGLGIHSTSQVGTVYWGAPSGGVTLDKGAVNVEKSNASTISLYFSLAASTSISSISAGRLCINPAANNTGEVLTYTHIPINFDSKKHQNYISFGPTGQPLGIGCVYTITITDSLQQVATWTGTVKVVS
jgi:hypothetical protein